MVKIEFINGRQPIEIDAETVAEAVQYAVKSWADLRGANLSGADLTDADLTDSNFRMANLRGSSLLGVDLSSADLTGANLQGANLREADLTGAHLYLANLTDANFDFACWPLFCGSLNVKIDKRIFCQLIYHALRAGQSVDDPEVNRLFEIPELVNLANQFHRVDECGKIS